MHEWLFGRRLLQEEVARMPMYWCIQIGDWEFFEGVIDSSVDMIGRWHEQSKAEESELG